MESGGSIVSIHVSIAAQDLHIAKCAMCGAPGNEECLAGWPTLVPTIPVTHPFRKERENNGAVSPASRERKDKHLLDYFESG